MAQLPTSLVAPIRHIAKQALGKEWQLYGLLLDHWETIVGDAWATQIHPMKLTFPGLNRPGQGQVLHNGVLTLRLPRGLAMEVQYQQPQIIARINDFIGPQAISRLNFIHSNLSHGSQTARTPNLPLQTREEIRAAVAPIDDPALRDALESLGTYVYSTPAAR
ncbi:MAG: DciA family protein [Alphaproteobacteria bacterium]